MSEGFFDDPCSGYGLVTILTKPDRLIFQAIDETGATRVSYTVSSSESTPPTIVTQPKDRTVQAGARARFRVAATGSPPFTYQWKEDGMDIPNATSASYITPPTTREGNGRQFTVVVSNLAGTVLSDSAKLVVRPLADR